MTKLAQDSLDQLREELRQRDRYTIKAICRRWQLSRSTVDRIRAQLREAQHPLLKK